MFPLRVDPSVSAPARSLPSTGAAGSFFNVRRDDTLQRWLTLREWSVDKRTSAQVEVYAQGGIWIWRVISPPARGEATSRKLARAAARCYVRTLSSSKNDRQLRLFL